MPRGRIRRPAAEKQPETPAKRRGGRRPHFDISTAPEPSTGRVGGIQIAKGNHPYFCAINEDRRYVVVRTWHGQNPVEVSIHATPREALDEMVRLNEAGSDAQL